MDSLVLLSFFVSVVLVLFFAIKRPYVQIGKLEIETYALAALVGPLLLFASGTLTSLPFDFFWIGDMSPLKILILFLSMVVLSIFLDEVGFFEFSARYALRWAGTSGRKLFFAMYAVVSFLTIFTSNDIIILTLTPFVYYFTKHAGLNPVPFLLTEFFAANAWSTFLPIGNPTNIYILSATTIPYLEYVRVMFLPTLVGGVVNAIVLYAIFHSSINQKIRPARGKPISALKDIPGAWVGLIILGFTTILLSATDFLHFPMWLIALGGAVVLLSFLLVRGIFTNQFDEIRTTIFRIPWSTIPFTISFFTLVYSLSESSFLTASRDVMLSWSGDIAGTVGVFGITSALVSNGMNNIPMSVAYASILSAIPPAIQWPAAYAATVGSNIGAYFTPFGALAGILWMSILRRKGVHLSYSTFILHGAALGSVVLLSTLIVLIAVLHY